MTVPTNDISNQEPPVQDGMVYKVMSGNYVWDLKEQPFFDSTNLECGCKVTTGTGVLYEKEEPKDDGDPLDYFLDWFEDVTDFKSRIKHRLESYGYLTEGDMADCADLTSDLNNPFIYFYGDIDKYQDAMKDMLSEELDELIDELKTHQDSYQLKSFRKVMYLKEALNKFEDMYLGD